MTDLCVVTTDFTSFAAIAVVIVVLVLAVPTPYYSRVTRSGGGCEVKVLPILAVASMCINASGQVLSSICSQCVAPNLLNNNMAKLTL